MTTIALVYSDIDGFSGQIHYITPLKNNVIHFYVIIIF